MPRRKNTATPGLNDLDKLARLAGVIGMSIDWRQAEAVERIYPGFLDAYEATQDAWEDDEKNRTTIHLGLRVVHPKSKRLSEPKDAEEPR